MELSPELHLIAQRNIQKYGDRRKSGPVESVCMDFLEFSLPAEPLVLFFFDPCEDAVLVKLVDNIRRSLEANPRAAYLIYVAPTPSKMALLDATEWLVRLKESREFNFFVYRSK